MPLIAFVTLGLPAGAVGVAWPEMRAALSAPLAGLGLLLAAVTIGYFLASATSGPLTARLGTPLLLISGCGLAALGLVGLSLATRWWMVPLVGLFLGGGSGLIDATINAYISLNRGVRYMGWLHGAWALGAALGPQVVVISLAAGGSWRAAFAALAVAFLVIGLVVGARRGDWLHDLTATYAAAQPDSPSPASRRALLLLMGFFLIGAGLEATAGDWSYTQLTAGRSLSPGAASWGASLFWAGLAAGRVALGVLGDRATPTRLLDGSVGITAVASVAFWLAPPLASAFIALPLLGFAVSVIFPLLLSLTPARVGAGITGNAVGYQLAAGALGGGGLPAGVGIVLQAAGLLALGPLLSAIAGLMVLLHLLSRPRMPEPSQFS
jgi:fucose permease